MLSQLKSGMVNKLNNLIHYELATAFDSDPLELERIFNKYRNVLHPNHFHMTGIKHSLSQVNTILVYCFHNVCMLSYRRK